MTVYINGVAQGGGAPTDADYLVGTTQGGLSAEIVAGAAPAGELGGTWAAPTVDGTHSGSAHHAEAHGAASHDDRTRTMHFSWVHGRYAGGAFTQTGWSNLTGAGIGLAVYADFADGAADWNEIVFIMLRMSSDMVAGTPNLILGTLSEGSAGNYVLGFRAFEAADGVGTLQDAGTVGTTGALSMSATAGRPEFETLAFPIATLGPNDWCRVSVGRLPTDANDTLAAGIGMQSNALLSYTADM